MHVSYFYELYMYSYLVHVYQGRWQHCAHMANHILVSLMKNLVLKLYLAAVDLMFKEHWLFKMMTTLF